MYIAVQGGEAAIEASRALLSAARRGDPAEPGLGVGQLRAQCGLLVDRVMAEASLADPELAALALKQARGDVVEAVFLLRAYRTTLPRWGHSEPLATAEMQATRRISAIYKDLPGGQLLGATPDYTQRLLDFALLADEPAVAPPSPHDVGAAAAAASAAASAAACAPPSACGPCATRPLQLPPALAALADDALLEPARPSPGDPEPPDITRDPPTLPIGRAARLQLLARADEGWLLGLAYSTQRGYAHTHPFGGEIRQGRVAVTLVPDELGWPIEIGELAVTECQMVNQFAGSDGQPPQFTRGYGLALGDSERKAMAMALVDRALRADEFGEAPSHPAQQPEFALAHGDNVEASGFVQHLKLPHYVTFESELQLLRALRAPAGGPTPPAGAADDRP